MVKNEINLGFIRTNNTCEMGVKNCVKYEDK